MEHTTIFLCDINGTYRQNIKTDIIQQQKIIDFIGELEKLRLLNNSQKLLFSFISSETEKVVNYESKLFDSYNNNLNIELGIQFFETGYIKDKCIIHTNIQGKVFQILFYLQQIQKKYQIDAVYYADDSDFYHFMLDELLSNSGIRDKIHFIVPSTRGGLEELIEITKKLTNNKKYNI